MNRLKKRMRGELIVAAIVAIIVIVIFPWNSSSPSYHPCCFVAFVHGPRPTPDLQRSIRLAIDDFGKPLQEAGFPVEFQDFNHEGDPHKRETIAKLINDNRRISVLILSSRSTLEPELRIYAEKHLPVLLPDNIDSQYVVLNLPNVFALTGKFDLQAVAAANFLDARNVKEVFIVHDGSLYAKTLVSRFGTGTKSFGIKSQDPTMVDANQRNFSGLLTSLAESKAEYVFFAGNFLTGSILAKQIIDAGIKTRFLATHTIDSPQVLSFLGPKVQQINYISLGGPVQLYPEARNFSEAFAKQYGTRPGPFSAHAYDAGAAGLKALHAAVQANNGKPPSRTQVVNALRRIKFQGASGTIAFGKSGERQQQRYFVMQISSTNPSQWLANKAIYSINVSD